MWCKCLTDACRTFPPVQGRSDGHLTHQRRHGQNPEDRHSVSPLLTAAINSKYTQAHRERERDGPHPIVPLPSTYYLFLLLFEAGLCVFHLEVIKTQRQSVCLSTSSVWFHSHKFISTSFFVWLSPTSWLLSLN